MTTQKRRIIYMTDEQWTTLQEWASQKGTTASAIVRDGVEALIYGRTVLPAPAYPSVSTAMAQAERDAILRRVNRKGSGA